MAQAEESQPEQVASGVSVGGGVHLYGFVLEAGQEVLGEDYALSLDVFYGRSHLHRKDESTRSDVLGFDFLAKFHLFLGDWAALYAGGGFLAAFDLWRWIDRADGTLRHGYSAGPGLLLTTGLKIRLFGDFYLEIYLKLGVAGGLERGGAWKGLPIGCLGAKLGFWSPVTAE